MIIKSFEFNKINLNKSKFFLLYGQNQGAKDEMIENIINQKKLSSQKYYENEIIVNSSIFFDSILSKSFFENEKIIVIKNTTNKIYKIIEELIEKNYNEIIILDAELLDKKSKLRNFFEKNKDLICIPFYPDNQRTLSMITTNYLIKKKINLSQESINLLTDRANGNRKQLYVELEKILNLSSSRKKINFEDVSKLSNTGVDFNVSELVDQCLAKNKFKVLKSINENNFKNDDTILIIRTFLSKAKRLLKLKEYSKDEQNLDNTISLYKPTIFWKEKDIVKIQMKIWSYEKVLYLINQINKTELLLKKTPQLSIYVLSNFILQCATKISN